MRTLITLSLVVLAGCTAPTNSNVKALVGGTLIDGSGHAPIPDSVVIVKEGRIISAGARSAVPVPAGAERLDATNKFIVPGLIDLHVHLGSTGGPGFHAADYTKDRVLKNLNSYLYFGVTTVRSIGTEREAGLEIRNEQRNGPVTTARLYTAGRGFTSPGGHPAQEVGDIARQPKDPEDARKQVAELASQRVDAIKIWIDSLGGHAKQVSRPVIEAIIDEAAKSNIPVNAHIYSLSDTKHFVEHGGAGLLHMVRDTEDVDEAFLKQLAVKKLVFTPTLIRQELGWYFQEKSERLAGPDIPRLVDEATLAAMREALKQGGASPVERTEFERAMRNTKKFAAAGVPIAVGSDGGSQMDLPGLMTQRECELLVEAGFTPLEAIKAATANGALGLRRDAELGTIEAGKRADLLVLGANPAEDIRSLRKIERIMLDGKWVNREGLALR